jgi:hypothetical protein
MATSKKTATRKTAPKKTAASKKNAPEEKGTRRPAIEMSSRQDESVDDWTNELTGWRADAVKILRALVSRHAPGSTLVMRWGQPVWQHDVARPRPASSQASFAADRAFTLQASTSNDAKGDPTKRN